MSFEILHISDVHFSNGSTSQKAFREEIIKKIRQDKMSADCLVISGDLFHRGSMDKLAAQAAKKYISELKNLLKKQVELDGQSTWVEPIVLVSPGNHDLDRDARKKDSDAYNVYLKRSDIVNKAGEAIKTEQGEYSIDSESEAVVLYQKAFDEFQRFSKEIGAENFCLPDAPAKVDNYEIQQRVLPLPGNQGAISLVFLNTALFAGQAVRYDGFRERKNNLEKEYKKVLEAGNAVEAARISLKIAKLQESYER